MEQYDFCGWATKANIRCSDGRIIMKDAFKHNDGQIVPLVWNHQHNEANNVLGHALLENREEGVYAYGKFNDTESGNTAKLLVEHGDINALSIYANQLKEHMSTVSHGNIREVSLVLAGANPEASIENVIKHGEESDSEAYIYTGEELSLYHADKPKKEEEEKEEAKAEEKKSDEEPKTEEKKSEEEPKEDSKEESKEESKDNEKTIGEILDTLNEEQENAVYSVIGQLVEDQINNNSEGGNKDMKQNVFDKDTQQQSAVLSHSDQKQIIESAKTSSVGSLQTAMKAYVEQSESLAHGIDQIENLFPDYKDVRPGAPELLEREQGWVSTVMSKIHKSPISRIRTRQADARIAELRAHGYQRKGDQKTLSANIKLIGRTTDPQTVYRKDELHRDDIIDITDFDVVDYQWGIMRRNLEEEIALAALIGDGREDGDADKIHEDHIRSIWNDEDPYVIHAEVDIEAARTELQGTNTSANFGENYIYAEAIITAALYSREKYKGSGTPDLYCTPHLVNIMLLARDLNGRRIYNSKADLAAALNVSQIIEIEQFEGKTRTDKEGNTKKLLGLFVNLADYQFGCTKGGEITKFNQFDIDFNKEKYLIETRLSGALTRVYSAIALEEPVVAG